MRRLADGQFFGSALDAHQIRAVCRAGVGLRWVAITFASFVGILTPHAPRLLIVEIPAAIIYNGLVMLALMRADVGSLRTIALVTTLIDQVFCLVFIGIYAIGQGTLQVAAYSPATIEAVALFGVPGAVLSTIVFAAGFLAVQMGHAVLAHSSVDSLAFFEALMTVILIASCLAAVHEAVASPAQTVVTAPNGAIDAANGSLRLTDREQSILRLIAGGSSNAAIASQLGISERAVKKCVERLLAQLRARNRIEAVAAASKLRLI